MASKILTPNKRDGADRRMQAVHVKFLGPQSMVACSSSRNVLSKNESL